MGRGDGKDLKSARLVSTSLKLEQHGGQRFAMEYKVEAVQRATKNRALVAIGTQKVGEDSPMLMYDYSLDCWVVATTKGGAELHQVQNKLWVFDKEHEVDVELILDPPGWKPTATKADAATQADAAAGGPTTPVEQKETRRRPRKGKKQAAEDAALKALAIKSSLLEEKAQHAWRRERAFEIISVFAAWRTAAAAPPQQLGGASGAAAAAADVPTFAGGAEAAELVRQIKASNASRFPKAKGRAAAAGSGTPSS